MPPAPYAAPDKNPCIPKPTAHPQTHLHTRTKTDRHTNISPYTLSHTHRAPSSPMLIFTSRHTHTNVYSCKHTQMFAHSHRHIKHSHPQLFKCLHIISHLNTCTHTYTHTYSHSLMHTHTHTYPHMLALEHIRYLLLASLESERGCRRQEPPAPRPQLGNGPSSCPATVAPLQNSSHPQCS